MNAESCVILAQQLVRLRSEAPPGEELAVAEYLADYLNRAGISARLMEAAPGRPNVIAEIKGLQAGPTLLFEGHLDVVPAGNLDRWTIPPYDGLIREGFLYGRGAADMKGGIAAMVSAAIQLAKDGRVRKGSLFLALVVDEEVQNKGVKHFLQTGLQPDWSIIGEPTGLDVCIGHRGVQAFRIKIQGKSAHASQPRFGVNAAEKALMFMNACCRLQQQIARRSDDVLGSASLTLTAIQCGGRVNVLPESCELMFDRRLIYGENRKSAEDELTELIGSLSQEDPNFSAEVETTTYCPPVKTDLDDGLTRTFVEVVLKETGKNPIVRAFEAACEASLLAEATRTKTIIFGPGSVSQAHQTDEHVPIAEIRTATRVYTRLAEMLLGKTACIRKNQ